MIGITTYQDFLGVACILMLYLLIGYLMGKDFYKKGKPGVKK